MSNKTCFNANGATQIQTTASMSLQDVLRLFGLVLVFFLPIVVTTLMTNSNAAIKVHRGLGSLRASLAILEKLLNSSIVMLYLDVMDIYKERNNWYFPLLVSSLSYSTRTNNQALREVNKKKPRVRRRAALNNGSIEIITPTPAPLSYVLPLSYSPVYDLGREKIISWN